MITKLQLDKFTAFESLDMEVSKGINILIGENGTGKTHIMKTIYSACCVIPQKENRTFVQKLESVFLPDSIGRLVKRSVGRGSGSITIKRNDGGEIRCEITSLNKPTISEKKWRKDELINATYIPVKDMLANAPGFRSLYATKNIHFEEIYSDIIDKALSPIPRGKPTPERKKLTDLLSKSISGKVVTKQEEFYLQNKQGKLEFTLLAEGFRKLGLLYILIQNETLSNGSILFWDEPETNLNPKLAKTVVKILVELQRQGVQIFIATHDYVLLKEFDMAIKEKDEIVYHSLYKEDDTIKHSSTTNYLEINPNPIDEAFDDILDREITKGMKGLGK